VPPVRTCVVRRERADPDALVRVFAGPDGVAHVDWHGRWKGRGAWLTCERAVIEEAQRKPGLLQRALDAGSLDVSGLLAEARGANATAVGDLLALSARAGAAVSGADALERTAAESLVALVFAEDASEASRAAATRQFPTLPAFSPPLTREALGHKIGKGPRAVLGLRPAAPVRALIRELRRMQALG
jgi:predicted RNA-binding protein YlxR (DUF448 family)